ncbi:substrate-binding domain-containing protein [Halalkalibacter kiskunsagensis]|uniref:Substrate-binding domain-containing protein n=1 Tax=Halalkalibacter kiskunsagensis TaxID=1548599 RepID=A0ABV6KCD7_9BACI
MLEKMKDFILLSIFSFFIVALVGCSSDASVAKQPESASETTVSEAPFEGSKDEVYYVISFLSGLDYWKSVFDGFQKAGDQFGVETKYTGDPGYDINQSVAVFEQVAATKPAGIAVAAINADALEGPINRAREQGIEVVTYDSDSPESDRSSFLSTGNAAAGEIAATHMAELMDEEGEIALLYTIGQQNVEERITGFVTAIEKQYPNMKVVVRANDSGDQTEGARALAAELQANPNIKGVFAANGVAGLGAATAVREAGKRDQIKIIGFDTDSALLDMVSEGEVDATIAQGTENMGYWSMAFLYHLKHDLAPESLPGFVDTGVNIVTKENVEEFYVE